MLNRSGEPRIDHVELRDGWALWRWTWIRAAGFPARDVLELAARDTAAVADRLNALDARATELRARAIDELRRLHEQGGVHARGARGALEQLVQGRLPRPDGELEAHVEALGSLRALEGTRAAHRAELEHSYDHAAERSSAALRAIAAEPGFREALLWQNRHALRTGVDWLLAHPEATNSHARQKQHLIASYLQRYTVKNDTIGFFGPIGWGELRASAGVEVRPGRQLLRARQVYFEHWAIDAVAATIAAGDDIKPFIAPRLVPSASLDGVTLRYGFDRITELPPVIARVLSLCDGETPAVAIARALVADASVDEEDDVYALLAQLVERKLVVWTLEPSALVDPERELRRLLERIELPAVRERALATLTRLETARDRVTHAAGDLPSLEAALEHLDATFHEITGLAATRRGGETYAARTPVYEDCVRDLMLVLGAPVLDRLAPVLALVAQSARWFSHEIAATYRAVLGERFRALRQKTTGPITYLAFWREIQDLLPEAQRTPGAHATAVINELDRRWAAVLDLDMSQARVERSASQLAAPCKQAFAAPGPGWPGARHVSPDVMIAAPSVEELARGNLTAVLGEVHLGNTFLARFIAPHGPEGPGGPEIDVDLIRAYEADVPEARLMPVETRQRVTRAENVSWSRRDLDLELGASRSWRTRERVLRAGDLVIEEAGASLVVREVTHGRTFDVIAFFEAYLLVMAANHFTPAPRGPHVPRVTIDGMVLCREQWRLSPSELPPAAATARGPLQFAAVRAWAHALGLPRWVFVKLPEEPKPVFLDLESPIYVEMFAKLARKASSMTISEMLPTVEDTWLPDAEGRTYTAELRMVMRDPASWAAPAGDGAVT